MTAQPRTRTMPHLSHEQERHLDRIAAHLAAAIDTSTPESIADGLAALYGLDLHSLLNELPEQGPDSPAWVGPHAPLQPASSRLYDDGQTYRRQVPGWWPYRPDQPHHCHRQGHWDRDHRQLVLACCGLDAT